MDMAVDEPAHWPEPPLPPPARSYSVPLYEPDLTVGYVYSAEMTNHYDSKEHPEDPKRITSIWRAIIKAEYHQRMKCIPIRPVKRHEALLVHSEDHWDKVLAIERELVRTFLIVMFTRDWSI